MVAHLHESILHVDMDAFYVEVERLSDSSLRGVPVIVGGLGNRGVVASASYEARAFGVTSAMPIVAARRLCPGARFVAPDHRTYAEVSRRVFACLETFTPVIEALSVDEAFLDIAGLRLHYQSAREVAEDIRTALRTTVGLPASVGASAIKFVAKLASESAKPDGVLVIPAGRETAFLHPMPVRRLWGVGEATHATLEGLGIVTIGDLAAVERNTLIRNLGASVGEHLHSLACGVDERSVEASGGAKSISVEETFDADLVESGAVGRELLRLAHRLAHRLRSANTAGRTVTIKVRFSDFSTVTRSHTLVEPIHLSADIIEMAAALFRRIDRDDPVRLLGVGISGLASAADDRQLSLTGARQEAIAEASARVRTRFGAGAVIPASLAEPSPSDVDRLDRRLDRQ